LVFTRKPGFFNNQNQATKMNKITITTFLLITCIGLFGYNNEPKSSKGIKFRQLTSTIKTDTSAVIEAILERAGVQQDITIYCAIDDDSLRFTGVVLPNDRNVTINYRASIKLK
jgi:hypothetical protein